MTDRETQNYDVISDDQVIHDPVNYHHVILAGVFVVFGISVLLGELEILLILQFTFTRDDGPIRVC